MKTHNTTQYRFDAMYAVCEFGGHLDLEYQYIYANGLLLARYDKSPADTHYYHHDGLGSIIGITDGNFLSPVERSYFYDEFGNELGSWGSVSNHYLYTGQEYDASISQLYNLRARLFDMRIGRFLVEDPILEYEIQFPSLDPHDMNGYLYVGNNPINNVDPMGLIKCDWSRIRSELGWIHLAFLQCCDPGWAPCYWKSSKIMGCIYEKVGPHIRCCKLGVVNIPWALPPGPTPHFGVGVNCEYEYGGTAKRTYEPWSCTVWPIPRPW
jgi:RHS repeat-associated protein